jgi:hypothetical protein
MKETYSFVPENRYKNSTLKAIEKYNRTFGDGSFPKYCSYFSPEVNPDVDVDSRVVEVISACLEANKDMLELGVVTLEQILDEISF